MRALTFLYTHRRNALVFFVKDGELFAYQPHQVALEAACTFLSGAA
jgi:hypothetical protein